MAGFPGQSHPDDGGAGGGGGGPNGGGGLAADGDRNGKNGNDGVDIVPLGSTLGGGGSAGNGYASFSYDDTYGILWDGGTITVENGRVTHVFFLPGTYRLTGAV